jgi:acyl-CoA thioester hydrolase
MFTHTINIRFRDLDALRHVNNSVYLTYLEESRIAYMQARQAGTVFDPQHGTIMAHSEIDYRFPATLGDTLVVEMNVGNIRRSSFEFLYALYRQSDRRLIARAMTIMVCYNYVLNAPVRMPDEWRMQLEADQTTV